jgi:polyhydroxyalkanoate synthesis regulator phasin
VQRAKYLLGTIDVDDVAEFFNHRTARVVLVLQRQLIDHMVEQGAISSKLADRFIGEIDDDADNIERERETTHKRILSSNMKKKQNEEKEGRDSVSSDRSSTLSRGSLISLQEMQRSESNSVFVGGSRTVSTNSVSTTATAPIAINNPIIAAGTSANCSGYNNQQQHQSGDHASSASHSTSPPRHGATFREALASPQSGKPTIIVNENFVSSTDAEFAIARMK